MSRPPWETVWSLEPPQPLGQTGRRRLTEGKGRLFGKICVHPSFSPTTQIYVKSRSTTQPLEWAEDPQGWWWFRQQGGWRRQLCWWIAGKEELLSETRPVHWAQSNTEAPLYPEAQESAGLPVPKGSPTWCPVCSTEDRCDRWVWNLLKKPKTAACITQKDLVWYCGCLDRGTWGHLITCAKRVTATSASVPCSKLMGFFTPYSRRQGRQLWTLASVSSHLLKTGHTCLAVIVNTLKEEGKTPVFQCQSEATVSKPSHVAIRMKHLGSFKNTVRAKLQLFVLNQVLVVYFVFMQNMFLFEQNKIVFFLN